jgi:deoxyribonuclease-4
MERIVNHPDLQSVPLVLETPTEDGKSFAWNIDRVRSLRRE